MTLRAAIRQGDEQLDSGGGIEHGAELLAEITRSAISAMHGPHAMDPDVLPPATTSASVVDVPVDAFSSRGAPAEK